MKNIFIVITILIFASCSKDFLELAPKDSANTAQFYKTENDFEVALVGAYGSLTAGGFADQIIYLAGLRSDNLTAFPNNGALLDVSKFTLNASSGNVWQMYNGSYQAIQAANAIIDRIEGAGLDQETTDRIANEAKFIRALAYFYLVNIYGDVPLITNEVTVANLDDIKSISRTTVNQVYTQIILDLEEVETNLGAYAVSNRASALAAKALMGKVYLFQKDYVNAAAKLGEVINSDQFSLVGDYGSLYTLGNAQNLEAIFVVEHQAGANTPFSNLAFLTAPSGTLGGFNIPNQVIYVEKNLHDAYGQNDIRRDINAQAVVRVGDQGAMNDTVYVTNKYRDDNPFENNNAGNTNYILRYADVLLMYSEALNRQGYVADGPAFDALNTVRTRAGLLGLTAGDLPNAAAFEDALIAERRLELAAEGERWFDLIRIGKAESTINALVSVNPIPVTIEENDLLFPIPEREVFNNPDVIEQNPGY